MATEAYTNLGAPGFLFWIAQELELSCVPESLTLSRLLCTTKGTGKNNFVDIPTAALSKWIKVRRETTNVVMPFAARAMPSGSLPSGHQAENFLQSLCGFMWQEKRKTGAIDFSGPSPCTLGVEKEGAAYQDIPPPREAVPSDPATSAAEGVGTAPPQPCPGREEGASHLDTGEGLWGETAPAGWFPPSLLAFVPYGPFGLDDMELFSDRISEGSGKGQTWSVSPNEVNDSGGDSISNPSSTEKLETKRKRPSGRADSRETALEPSRK
ncbi:unnamed protein product, partial [Discosporangium mesarthrocarpum]